MSELSHILHSYASDLSYFCEFVCIYAFACVGVCYHKVTHNVKVRRCRPRTSSPPTPTKLRLRSSRCVNLDRSETNARTFAKLAMLWSVLILREA